MRKNIPNILTIFRLILIPIFVIVFFSGTNHSLIYSVLIFFLAGLTDVLDGYIARKYNLITRWGIVLDPLADKLMLLTVLACLAIGGIIPYWVLIIVLAKEVSMITAGILLYKKDTVVPSNFYGKASTVLFYLAIFIVSVNESIGYYFIYIAVLSAIIAFITYLMNYLKNHRGNSKE